MAIDHLHNATGHTAQELRQDKMKMEEDITKIMRDFEEKYPGYLIKNVTAFRQTLTGDFYLKMQAFIEINITNPLT